MFNWGDGEQDWEGLEDLSLSRCEGKQLLLWLKCLAWQESSINIEATKREESMVRWGQVISKPQKEGGTEVFTFVEEQQEERQQQHGRENRQAQLETGSYQSNTSLSFSTQQETWYLRQIHGRICHVSENYTPPASSSSCLFSLRLWEIMLPKIEFSYESYSAFYIWILHLSRRHWNPVHGR